MFQSYQDHEVSGALYLVPTAFLRKPAKASISSLPLPSLLALTSSRAQCPTHEAVDVRHVHAAKPPTAVEHHNARSSAAPASIVVERLKIQTPKEDTYKAAAAPVDAARSRPEEIGIPVAEEKIAEGEDCGLIELANATAAHTGLVEATETAAPVNPMKIVESIRQSAHDDAERVVTTAYTSKAPVADAVAATTVAATVKREVVAGESVAEMASDNVQSELDLAGKGGNKLEQDINQVSVQEVIPEAAADAGENVYLVGAGEENWDLPFTQSLGDHALAALASARSNNYNAIG